MSDNTQAVSLDLGAMMDQTLDTIQDAPEFSNPPAGEYTIDVKECAVDKYKTKADPNTEKQRLKLTYSIAETISVAGNDQPVPDGTLFTETFQATEQGLSYFKTRIKNIMNVSDLAGVSLADMMASVKGMQFRCRITIKKSPNPQGGEYENLQIRVIASKQ